MFCFNTFSSVTSVPVSLHIGAAISITSEILRIQHCSLASGILLNYGKCPKVSADSIEHTGRWE